MMAAAVTILLRSTFSTKHLTYSLAGAVSISSEVPVCCISPSRMIAIRSPSLTASSRSCVINTMFFFIFDCKASSSSCICTRISGSRAEKASSISRTSGSLARARANPTRCCMPPDSSLTFKSAYPSSPTRRMLSAAFSSRSLFSTPCSSSPKAIFCNTV